MDTAELPAPAPSPGRLSLPKVAVACIVFAFAGFGVGAFVNRERPIAHNEADIGFLRDMMRHHEQAIEMSVVAVRRATSADVRQEALDILLAQRGEYVQMRDRLRAYGVAPTTRDGSAMSWMGHSVPVGEMPGLATEAQMAGLRAASGKDVDARFLQLMTVHHRAGAEMAQEAVERGRDRWVLGMADTMVAVQEQEIADMRKWGGFIGLTIEDPGPVMQHSSGSMKGMDHSPTSGTDHDMTSGTDHDMTSGTDHDMTSGTDHDMTSGTDHDHG
jgi:uncharacterized protein (DUF305 family)